MNVLNGLYRKTDLTITRPIANRRYIVECSCGWTVKGMPWTDALEAAEGHEAGHTAALGSSGSPRP